MSAATWASLPPELRDLCRFVVWHEATGGRPFCASDPRRAASSTDPATWSTFAEAVAACEQGRADGIGFVFSADDPFCGVDLDHCRDPETGAVLPAAQRIVDDFATYTEVSPSGTGLHLICVGKLPPGAWHKRKVKTQAGSFEVELYDSGRYFRMTGDTA